MGHGKINLLSLIIWLKTSHWGQTQAVFLFQRPPPPKKVRGSSSDRDAESGSPSESEPTPSESDSGKNSDQVITHTKTTWYDCLVVCLVV